MAATGEFTHWTVDCPRITVIKARGVEAQADLANRCVTTQTSPIRACEGGRCGSSPVSPSAPMFGHHSGG